MDNTTNFLVEEQWRRQREKMCIGKDKEMCSGERKSQSYKFFGLRNKYRMY